MPNYVHRTNKRYLVSVSPASLPEPEANYIQEPDLLAVIGVPSKYWNINGDVITLMSQAEQDAVDLAELSERLDSIADEIDAPSTYLKAFAEVVLDQINALRADHGRPAATLAQLKAAVRAKL